MAPPPPFVIFGLPRSRTYWLSRFLTHGDWHCGHDELRHMGSMDDVRAWLSQPFTGTVETAGSPWWRLLMHFRPDVRIVTIRRPVDEVAASCARIGWPADLRKLRQRDRKLDQIEARVPGMLSVTYADLAEEHTCASLFEHCLAEPHDHERWVRMSGENMQINPAALTRYVAAYLPRLTRLAASAKHISVALMADKQHRADPDGVTVQQETVDQFLADAAPLFAEHAIAVGEHPKSYLDKNIPLLRALERFNAVIITTARSNGRMFGYLVALVSPSLESPTLTNGVHTLFYASPLFPGLGMKIQRHSVRKLTERGVGVIDWRAGVRGSADRTGILYRRLGAKPFGEIYRLDLRETRTWA